MSGGWSAEQRFTLVRELADRQGAVSEALLGALGLGAAYARPAGSASKLTRINAALQVAENEGRIDEVLQFIDDNLHPPESASSATMAASPELAGKTAVVPAQATMPAPVNSAQRTVVQVVWDLFFVNARWPTFHEVDQKLDRDHDINLDEIGPDLPQGLILPPDLRHIQNSDLLRLTVAAVTACVNTEEDLTTFLGAVRLAALEERTHVGTANTHAQLTPDLLGGLTLPAAGRDQLLLRVGLLLGAHDWGWTAYASGDPFVPTWSFQIGRGVRRLRDVQSIEDFWAITHPPTPAVGDAKPVLPQNVERQPMTKPETIFLVHGHDPARHEVKDFLRDVVPGVEVQVLSEKASRGKTIIEKFEAYGAAATCAVVLLTPDDVGRASGDVDLKPRARQNVVLELGYFIGRLGRDSVIVLNKGGVEKPSDVAGVVYIDYPAGNWKVELMRELREHFDVDANAVL